VEHTSGPWRVYEMLGNTYILAGREESPICVAKALWNEFSYEKEANARLIAAAPDLLAALKDILPVFRLWVPMATDLTQWKNALDVIDRAERSRSKVARQVKITEYESINRSATRYAVEDILSGEFIRENFMSREDAESFAAKNGWTVIAAKAEGRSDV